MLLFVCTSGEDEIVDMVTLDKGLAFMCRDRGICDNVVEEETCKSYDEVCGIVFEGVCDMTLEDLQLEL